MFYVTDWSVRPCFLQGYNVTFVKRPGCDIDVVREAELNLKRENQGTRIQKQIETSATCKSEGCVPPRARAHFGRLRLVQQRQGGSREHSQHFPRPHQVNLNSTYSTSMSRILSRECLPRSWFCNSPSPLRGISPRSIMNTRWFETRWTFHDGPTHRAVAAGLRKFGTATRRTSPRVDAWENVYHLDKPWQPIYPMILMVSLSSCPRKVDLLPI